MTTGTQDGYFDFDAKFLGVTETMVRVLVMPGAIAMMIPKVEEMKRAWDDPELPLGKMIEVRVRKSYAQINQIMQNLGSKYGMGGGPILS